MSGLGGKSRWLAEGLVIVFSVLLAFWIDAWWDGVQAGRHEAAVVESVRDELERNRPYARGFVAGGSAHIDRIERFLESTPDELRRTPDDSVHPLVEAMWLPPTFDPDMAAVTLLLETPPRGSEESLRIHRLVGLWRNQLEDAREEGSDLREHASVVVDYLAARTASLPRPPRSAPIAGWVWGQQNRTWISNAIEQSGPVILARLRADDAFVAALARKIHDQRRYVFEIARAAERLDSVLVALPGPAVR